MQGNKELGLQFQNGPLESGWVIAAMAITIGSHSMPTDTT